MTTSFSENINITKNNITKNNITKNNTTNNKHNINNIITNLTNTTYMNIVYRNCGWYLKSKTILKYLNNNQARCYQCYNMIDYENIMYSRILSNNDNNIKLIGNIICLCKICCDANINNVNHFNHTNDTNTTNIKNNNSNKTIIKSTPKYAPKNYSDILADYILNNKIDLIINDIEKIGQKEINAVEDKINYLKFNINEKQVILNSLANQNKKLTENLDLEVEKFKLLNKQYSQNKELCDNIKNQLLQFSVDLFKENKKQIDDQINKYIEINNSTKYSVPECKICMNREIRVAITCGHVFCMECYDQLVKNCTAKHNNSFDDVDYGNNGNYNNNKNIPIITCPTCRTESHTYTQLYF